FSASPPVKLHTWPSSERSLRLSTLEIEEERTSSSTPVAVLGWAAVGAAQAARSSVKATSRATGQAGSATAGGNPLTPTLSQRERGPMFRSARREMRSQEMWTRHPV